MISRDFSPGGDLMTLGLRTMILADPANQDDSIVVFKNPMTNLRVEAEKKNLKPTLIWAATDSASLLRVARPLEASNPGLLQWLHDHASFADLSKAVRIKRSIEDDLVKPDLEKRLALTGSRKKKGGPDYNYSTHFAPNAQSGDWSNGPYCAPLDNPPKWLDDLNNLLHRRHEVLFEAKANVDGNEIDKTLRKSDISVARLDDLMSTL